jgi:hypothetical protein
MLGKHRGPKILKDDKRMKKYYKILSWNHSNERVGKVKGLEGQRKDVTSRKSKILRSEVHGK